MFGHQMKQAFPAIGSAYSWHTICPLMLLGVKLSAAQLRSLKGNQRLLLCTCRPVWPCLLYASLLDIMHSRINKREAPPELPRGRNPI